MKKKLIPIKDKVLVKPDEAETKTEAGIIIPDTAQEIPSRGTVIAVGPECTEIKPKMHIIYGKSTGFNVEIEGEKFKMMREEEILLISK